MFDVTYTTRNTINGKYEFIFSQCAHYSHDINSGCYVELDENYNIINFIDSTKYEREIYERM